MEPKRPLNSALETIMRLFEANPFLSNRQLCNELEEIGIRVNRRSLDRWLNLRGLSAPAPQRPEKLENPRGVAKKVPDIATPDAVQKSACPEANYIRPRVEPSPETQKTDGPPTHPLSFVSFFKNRIEDSK